MADPENFNGVDASLYFSAPKRKVEDPKLANKLTIFVEDIQPKKCVLGGVCVLLPFD